MTIFCTYCSAEKDKTEGLLPAINRYNSERVRHISMAALFAKLDFYILSGKYGLLQFNEPIPYYDHLLVAEEVEAHSLKVAEQIKQHSISQIIFFTLSVAADEKLAPYHACLRLACQEASISLSVVEIDFA